MKGVKQLVVWGTAATLIASSTLHVSAAGLRDVFDAKFYADSYADLKEAFGYDEGALYEHFLTYGLKEGRSASVILDVVKYREKYGDLDAAFGDNWDAYVEHYFTYGLAENRDGGALFNPAAYAAAYPDVAAAFGDDAAAIINHYLTYGIQEGRTAGVTAGGMAADTSASSSGNTNAGAGSANSGSTGTGAGSSNSGSTDTGSTGPNVSTEKTDAEKLAEAKTAAETALGKLTATNDTEVSAVLTAITGAAGTGVTAAWKDNTPAVKTDATEDAAGSIKGTITLTVGSETADVEVNLTIAQLENQ